MKNGFPWGALAVTATVGAGALLIGCTQQAAETPPTQTQSSTAAANLKTVVLNVEGMT